MAKSNSKHHYLVSGRILFKAEENEAANVDVNCMITSSRREIGVKQIAQMQQYMQINLFNRLGGPVDVLNITIATINYLGSMTDEEFNNATPAELGQTDPTVN